MSRTGSLECNCTLLLDDLVRRPFTLFESLDDLTLLSRTLGFVQSILLGKLGCSLELLLSVLFVLLTEKLGLSILEAGL